MSKLGEVILRGATGAKPAAGVEGRLFYDTDLDQLERDNGSSWDVCEPTAWTVDAADVTYTPNVATDWDGDADPGNTGPALDQLAARLDDVEGTVASSSHAALTLAADAGAILSLSTQELGFDTQNANKLLAGPASGGDADPTFRALVADDLPANARTRTINYILGGGTTAIATGVVKGDLVFDFDGTLLAWTLLADQAGAIKIDIWKDTYANFPPTDADSICNGHEPEIAASADKAQDTDLSDWADVTIAAGDIWRLNVDSCTDITAVTLCLKVVV